jgi:WD40 repeat protein
MDSRVYRWKFLRARSESSWNAERTRLERYVGHASVVSVVKFHPVGALFLSGDWDGGLFAWKTYDSDAYQGFYDKNQFLGRFYTDIATRQVALRPLGAIETLQISPDGELFVLGFSSGALEFWLVRGMKLRYSSGYHKAAVSEVLFDSTSRRAVSVGRDGTLVLWSCGRNLQDLRIVGTRLEEGLETAELHARGVVVARGNQRLNLVPWESFEPVKEKEFEVSEAEPTL